MYYQIAYAADINYQYNLGLDFLKENNFKLDFKNNELHLSLKLSHLKLIPSKCNLFRLEVDNLGHFISISVRTQPEKISPIKDWSRPEDDHQLLNLLGLCTYYRKLVKSF
ncbi:retrovirus-related Pol polyprotein from transposon 412 [Nephila pilipes]|uniref:Retrovirus-related Pol polyprotein from transposon 412 n=1 Tax=Nephila pilipes TaxID=299642 RepID=A0A8X6QP16_NEPPI|nr:retrovirus-related Pol polyprotein from transposon 412 [Nephila pilipes]